MTVRKRSEGVSAASPLYMFLWQCEQTGLPKEVLDCGAGGKTPPLALFHAHGYKTAGIEIDPRCLGEASDYCRREGVELGITSGDMRSLPFDDETFSFAYSWNAVFFMTKEGIERAIGEMWRVLRPSGLCYVRLMSVDDPDERPFKETSYLRNVLGNERFSKHGDDEADGYFADFDVMRKEKRIIWTPDGEGTLKRAYLDYVVRKRT